MIETKNLTLIPHLPEHLLALRKGIDEYEKISGRRIANGVRDFLLAGSPDFFSQLETATAPDPWQFGFAVIHKIDHRLIGMCSFTGSPDSNGVVEIAYGIAPDYQGKGYATETAGALIDLASQDERVRTICAHTLREANASTRVLGKCGFKNAGEIVDSENNLVWRWEKHLSEPH
jgi:RimJ/RimL family protein N-acetyltransferase